MRARYWREAWTVYENSTDVGAGAGAYATARTRYRDSTLTVRHAHGYGVQTLADLGRVGVAISLLATVLWILAAMTAHRAAPARSRQALRPRADRAADDGGRGRRVRVHSLIDWTWFVPGNACVALLCAAWVAGRGPLAAREDTPPRVPFSWRRPPRAAATAAVAVLALAVVTSWAALQPVRSAHAADAALDLAQLGKYDAAAAKARRAAALDPLSVDPLFQLAFIDDARGDKHGAKRALEDADAAAARQLRGVAAARALPAVRARRRARRGRRVQSRLLSRPRLGSRALGLPRGPTGAQGQGLAPSARPVTSRVHFRVWSD